MQNLREMASKDAYKRSTAISLGLILLGFVAMFLGWNGAAGVDFVSGQVPYLISGGAIGLAMVLVGLALLFIQNSRKEHAELTKRIGELVEILETRDEREETGPLVVPKGSVVAGASSYHLATCRLAQGRADAEVISVDEAEDRGLNPCRICSPG